MSRHFVSLLGVLLLSAVALPAQQTGQTMRVNASRVRLRTGASIDSGIVKELPKGSVVTVVSTDGNWAQVRMQGQSTTGWIRSDLLVAAPDAAVATTSTSSASTTASTPPPATQMASSSGPTSPPPPPAKPMKAAPPPPPPPAPKMASAHSGQHGGLALYAGLTSFKETDKTSGESSGSASGFMAGFGILAPVGDHFGIEIDFDYLQNGFATTDATPKVSTHVNTASGSFLLRPIFGNGPAKFFVLGGPYFRAAINCSYSPAQASDCAITKAVNRFGGGAELGAGVMFGRLEVQGRYDIGLTNLDNSDDGATIKSSGFMIMAGFVL